MHASKVGCKPAYISLHVELIPLWNSDTYLPLLVIAPDIHTICRQIDGFLLLTENDTIVFSGRRLAFYTLYAQGRLRTDVFY